MNIKSINSKKRYSKKAASFILTLVLIFTTVFSNCMAINVNAAKKISLNNKKITVSVGSKKTIKVKNAPKKAKITFKTNKKKIATVTKKGVVKGIKQGKAKITVTVKYKSGKKNVSKKLTCTVTVNKKKSADKTSEQTKTDNKTDNTSEQAKDDSKADNTSEQTKDNGGTDNSSQRTNNDAKSDDKADNGSGQDNNENKDNENKDDNTDDTENEKDKVVLADEETIRLVIGGVPNEVSARDSGDDWYVKPEIIKTYLDADVEGTVDGCASLLEVCKSKNISYEYDDVLRAAYIWDSEKYAGNYNADYYHAFEVGLAPYSEFENYDRIVTTTEFRDMLINMINRVDPDKLAQFEENVTDYEGTLHNGEAIGMMYYASLCLNCLEYNATGYDEAPLWEDNDLAYDKLFPHYDELSENMLPDLFPGQSNHFAANIYMNCHESVYSGERPLMYDKKRQTYDQNAETTYHTIVSMTNDVYYASENLYKQNWVELDDEKVTQIDNTIYNEKLKAIGDSRVQIKGEDLPRSTGLMINNAPSYDEIIRMDRMSALDVRNNSNWGFNYVDYQLDYTKLFGRDVTQCNLREFEELDEFVASAVRYNIRLNLTFVFLPGKYTTYDTGSRLVTTVYDIYSNPGNLEQINTIFRIISERYKDVPSANLSFTPILEISSCKDGSYTTEDVTNVVESIFDTIRAADPDRYIVWEIVHGTENMEHVTDFINVIEDALEKRYDNYEIRGDYGELSFVYQDMNNDDYEGNNRDVNNHSMFKQGWPVTYYAVNYKFKKDEPMNFTGLLPKDTKVEIFFDNTLNCNFEAYGDDELIYTQAVTEGKHNVGSWVSIVYSFAESDYSIEFTLDKTLDKLSLTTDGEQLVISGIRLTLPEEYAVYRWWFPSWYDNGDYGEWPSKKLTSQVLICPTSWEGGSDIVINEDMLYTSDTIHVACNRESLNRYMDVYAKAAGYSSIRLESPTHTTGIMHTATMAYYSDLLPVMNEHDIGWVPLGGLMELRNVHADEYPEANEGVKYHAYPALDVDLLKVFQKYQNSERP